MITRRTVSYFDHQAHSTALMDPGLFFTKYGAGHMADIKSKGFDEVVICVTELDMRSDARLKLLADLTYVANEQGLLVTADPWRVGGIFGGEGVSFYEQNGGKPCTCEPELDKLLSDWIDVVATAGIKRIFWDEPGIECQRGNPNDNSLNLIDQLSREAVTKGIAWNTSCIRSRASSVDMSDAVASLEAINEIAVAPYPFHPQNPVQKSALEVVGSIAPWFEKIRAAADKHGIEAQAWMQGFNISAENLPVLEVYLREIEKANIGNFAVWGYNGCKTITDLTPATALPAETTWAEVCRLVEATRQR